MTANFLSNLMSPLGREHCMLFFYIGFLFLFLTMIMVLVGVFNLFDSKTRMTGAMMLVNSISTFFIYYVYRILYSICSKVL